MKLYHFELISGLTTYQAIIKEPIFEPNGIIKATIVGVFDGYTGLSYRTPNYKACAQKELIVGGSGATFKLIEFEGNLK